MTPLRALHVHSGNIFGGIESTLVTLARRAALCPDIAWRFALTHAAQLSDELTRAGAVTAVIGAARASRPWTVWAARSQLARLLDREPADVAIVHSEWSHALFGGMLARRGIPVVYWLHGPLGGPLWLRTLARRTQPSFVIVNSHSMAAQRGWLAAVPHEVLYNPIETARAAAGPRAEPPVILMACRMEPGKGHPVLLEALAGMTNLPWQCWIAGAAQSPGEARHEHAVRERCRALGLDARVTFLGQRSDMPALLRQATLYCQPNTSPEAFGNVFVEALGAGLPVVTSGIGAAPEILNDSCGILLQPHDAGALRAALTRLLADGELRTRLAGAGPARALQLCDPAVQIPKLAALLHRVAP